MGGHVTGRGRGHPCHLGPGAHLGVWGLRPVRAGVSAGIVPRRFSPKWGVCVSPHEARLSPGLSPCGPLAADPVAPPRPLGLTAHLGTGNPVDTCLLFSDWGELCAGRVDRATCRWHLVEPQANGGLPTILASCPGHWAPLHRQGSGEAARSETWRALCWASGCCFQGA